MVKLSIIIVNFNTTKLVLDCLNSIEKNKLKVNFEVIVVDNGSREKEIRKLDTFKTDEFTYKLIKNHTNLGYAKANNIGINVSTGEYLLLLNSDTIVTPNSLDVLLDDAENLKNAGVVAPKLINLDGTSQGSVMKFPTLVNAIKEFWLGKKGLFGLYSPKGDGCMEVEAVVGAAFLITPTARKQVGLLNERYFMYFEDLDYCRRVNEKGLKVYYCPTSVVIHYHGESGKDLAEPELQWKRNIPSSKIYYGRIRYYLIFAVMWSGQKLKEFKREIL